MKGLRGAALAPSRFSMRCIRLYRPLSRAACAPRLPLGISFTRGAIFTLGDIRTLVQEAEETLLDYEEEEQDVQDKAAAATEGEAKDSKKGHYVGVHSSGFRDFMLKPELLRAVVDCGFEHPSEGT